MAEFDEQWNKGTFPGWMVIVIKVRANKQTKNWRGLGRGSNTFDMQ